MTKLSMGIAVLAAGKGTRMKWEGPKALAPLLGKKLIDYSISAAEEFARDHFSQYQIGIVVGHLREQVESYISVCYPQQETIKFAVQREQLGTADALRSYFDAMPDAWNKEFTTVLCADTPLLTKNELNHLWKRLAENPSLEGVAATFIASKPTGYGRIIRGTKGFSIREEKDATPEERRIHEVNSGLYIFKTKYLKEHLNTISAENSAKEFYLTDLFKLDKEVEAVCFDDSSYFEGVNSLEQLSEISRILRKKKAKKLMLSGVLIIDPDSAYIEWDVQIKPGAILHPSVYLYGKTVVHEEAQIEPGTVIKDSIIHSGAQILANSYLEDSVIQSKASIGPMARIRPGSDIGSNCKIGNFVEVKKSKLERGSKVSHLSYIGDAEIGENSNIGCGFITCNYDGVKKHKTTIGSNTFIGSDCQAIAPIKIGSDVFVGAGSTLNKDIPDGTFAIARTQQVNREGMAKRFLPPKKADA